MKQFQLSIKSMSFILFSLLFGMVFIASVACNQGPPKNSKAAQAERGKAHFKTYCEVCHGADAKGLKIDTLDTQPKDLTKIMKRRYVSNFPVLEIARIIDGRKITAAHGTREMPVWGERFSTEEHLDESQIKGKMGEIIAYLMSIQE